MPNCLYWKSPPGSYIATHLSMVWLFPGSSWATSSNSCMKPWKYSGTGSPADNRLMSQLAKSEIDGLASRPWKSWRVDSAAKNCARNCFNDRFPIPLRYRWPCSHQSSSLGVPLLEDISRILLHCRPEIIKTLGFSEGRVRIGNRRQTPWPFLWISKGKPLRIYCSPNRRLTRASDGMYAQEGPIFGIGSISC